LRVLENRVLKRMFEPKSEEAGGNCINFIICIVHQILLGLSNQ